MSESHGRHQADGTALRHPPPPPDQPGFLDEVKDAVSVRTFTLVVGVLLLQLAFILSYVGAFHSPKPHEIPIAVVAPAQVSAQLVDQLNKIGSDPVRAMAVADEATARGQLEAGTTSGVLVVNPTGTQDTLLVASGGGVSVATAVEGVVEEVAAAQQRTVTVTDVVPLQDGDGRGLTGFYLVIGWIVGGYLVAALLGVAKGSLPANPRRAMIRLLAIVPYAVLSGLGGALIVDPLLGAATGHLLALWGVGALLVFASAAVTMAFQVLFGVLGIGLTVLFFVVLGNPSAGGAYQPALLAPFWRAISGALPNGAGTDTVRRIVYYDSAGIGGHLLVIAGYAVVGTVLALVASVLMQRRSRPRPHSHAAPTPAAGAKAPVTADA